MSLKPEAREALKNLGFSEYNIIIYETLLKEHEIDARVLSQRTKVPYSRVYEVLNEMIEKGFIVKIDGRPSTYVPKSPVDVLQEIYQRQEEAFTRNSSLVKEPLMSLFNETRSAHTAQVTITYGVKTNVTHVKNLVKNAVLSLSCVLHDASIILPEIIDELKVLKIKNVKPRILLPASMASDDIVASIKDLGETRFMAVPPANLVIADEKNAMFVVAGDYVKNVSEDMVGMSMSHASAVFVAKQLFKHVWDASA